MHHICYFLLFFWAAYIVNESLADDTFESVIEGNVTIHDGDSIRMHDHRIRLAGIDAPELSQKCYKNENDTKCGVMSRYALIKFIAADTVRCKVEGRDNYNRLLAHCYVRDTSINSWMVKSGYALAYRHYSRRYVADENTARRINAGIHAYRYTYPWQWRQQQRQ